MGGHSCQYPFIPESGRGAIYNTKIASLTNCTVCFNSNGGGIYNAEGTITIKNTIAAGNHGDEQTIDMDVAGNISSKGYNLIESTDGCTITGDTTGNITGIDANLGALSDNGGEPHALMHYYPAAPPSMQEAADVPKPINGDIGDPWICREFLMPTTGRISAPMKAIPCW